MSLLKIARYSSQFIRQRIDDAYGFHNIFHTKYVVEKTKFLANKNGLKRSETELAIIAAWAHDLGYEKGREGHELRSNDLISAKMLALDYSNIEILAVQKAIWATKIPQSASTMISKCLCDADLAHLASPRYESWAKKLTQEWVNTERFKNDANEMIRIQIDFISKHRFLTPYAQHHWESKKEKVLKELKEKLN